MNNIEIIWSDKQYVNTNVRKTTSIYKGQIIISAGIIADIKTLYNHCNVGFASSNNILVIRFCENGAYKVVHASRGRSLTINCLRAFEQFGLVLKDARHSYHAEVQTNNDIFIFLNEEVAPYFRGKKNG